MKLIRTKRGWQQWLRAEITPYETDVQNATEPKEYPCFGYHRIESYNYQELAPLYLYAEDLAKMQRQLAAKGKAAPQGEGA
jgi:hypothetical protein